MRLIEALQIINQPIEGAARRRLLLACGFSPLHLATYLDAFTRMRFPRDAVEIVTGQYGDLEAVLRGAGQDSLEGALVILEWSALDPRLGLRSGSPWNAAEFEHIVQQVGERLGRIEGLIRDIAVSTPVAIVEPTIELPPLSHLPACRADSFELRLRSGVAEFLARIADLARVKVVSEAELARRSPEGDRHDIALDLYADFPANCRMPLPWRHWQSNACFR